MMGVSTHKDRGTARFIHVSLQNSRCLKLADELTIHRASRLSTKNGVCTFMNLCHAVMSMSSPS